MEAARPAWTEYCRSLPSIPAVQVMDGVQTSFLGDELQETQEVETCSSVPAI